MKKKKKKKKKEQNKNNENNGNCPPKKNHHTGDININIFKIHNNKKQIFKIKGEGSKKKIMKTVEGSEEKNNSNLVLCNKKVKIKKKKLNYLY